MYPKVDLTEKLASVPDVIEQPRSASLDVCPREGGGGGGAEYVVVVVLEGKLYIREQCCWDKPGKFDHRAHK